MRWWADKLAVLALLAAAGCGAPCKALDLDTEGVRAARDYSALAEVLEAVRLETGLADEYELDQAMDRLDEQLRLLAVAGPTATPQLFLTPEQRLAYWYNARTAWSLKLLAVDRDRVSRVLCANRSFPLDGRTMTIGQIDEQHLSADKDFRTRAAAPGVSLTDAPLPTEPFTARDVRDRIAERFTALLDDPMRFRIDHPAQRVYVPRGLWQAREELVARYERQYGTRDATLLTALAPLVTGGGHERVQSAVGYDVQEAPPWPDREKVYIEGY